MAAPKLGLLGEVATTDNSIQALYTPSAPSRRAVVSSIIVCNTTTAQITYRVYLRIAGAAAANGNAACYEMTLDPNGTDTHTWGVGLDGAVGDAISVRASVAGVNFIATGLEEDIPTS